MAVAASGSSADEALPGTAGNQCRVYNGSAAMAFVRFGVGAQTAVLTDSFVAPGNTEVFSIPPTVDTVAAILSTGTGNVYFQRGMGL